MALSAALLGAWTPSPLNYFHALLLSCYLRSMMVFIDQGTFIFLFVAMCDDHFWESTSVFHQELQRYNKENSASRKATPDTDPSIVTILCSISMRRRESQPAAGSTGFPLCGVAANVPVRCSEGLLFCSSWELHSLTALLGWGRALHSRAMTNY